MFCLRNTFFWDTNKFVTQFDFVIGITCRALFDIFFLVNKSLIYQNKHYNIDQKDKGTLDDRRRDGGTNFILRFKEQETRLTLHEQGCDDDDDDKVTVIQTE